MTLPALIGPSLLFCAVIEGFVLVVFLLLCFLVLRVKSYN